MVGAVERVRVSCHSWERRHCDSCHEDNDSWGFDLLEYEIGCIRLEVCCEIARELGLAD